MNLNAYYNTGTQGNQATTLEKLICTGLTVITGSKVNVR